MAAPCPPLAPPFLLFLLGKYEAFWERLAVSDAAIVPGSNARRVSCRMARHSPRPDRKQIAL